jgi:hypothetical protein
MEDFDDGTGGVESDGLDSGTSASVGRVEALRIAVAIIIVAIWALIYLRAAIDAKFSPPPELSGIMLLVVAWLFGTTALRGKR